MAKPKKDAKGLNDLKKRISDGDLCHVFAFYGEERYLLEYYLGEIRKKIIDGGMDEFNHKKLTGKGMTAADLREAVDALPVFAERTMVEIDDYDIFRQGEDTKNELISIFSDLPEYTCVVFVYDTLEYKPDGRVKINAALRQYITEVEFAGQDQNDLINWISRRFRALGRQIDRATADYLVFMGGDLMTKLIGEIEKVAAYSTNDFITKADIDAVVTPVIDAVTYKMTDAIINKNYKTAMVILSDLFALEEPPHKIIYSLSLRMRQLYCAWVCQTNGRGISELMDMLGLKNEYQAKGLMQGAKRAGGAWCKEAMGQCADTAYKLNSSGSSGQQLLTDLLLHLRMIDEI